MSKRLKSEDFTPVVEACTLCDMCFMTKCPYVPPHPFMLDFPHLMLRHRVVEAESGKTEFHPAPTGRDGPQRHARPPRFAAHQLGVRHQQQADARADGKDAGIDRQATLPKFHTRTFVTRPTAGTRSSVNKAAPAFGKRKAALYATCFVNYNKPETGMAARAVLNHIGVETKVAYPGCCGMPFLEQAELARVAENAAKVSKELVQADRRGL